MIFDVKVNSKNSIHFQLDDGGAFHLLELLQSINTDNEQVVALDAPLSYRGKRLLSIVFRLGEKDDSLCYGENVLTLIFSTETHEYVIWSLSDAIERSGFQTPELASFYPIANKDVQLALYGIWLDEN